MSINQVTPGQGWLQTLNNDLTDLDGSVIQRTNWEKANAVLLNGFSRAVDWGDVSVRYLKNCRGDILETEIYGVVTKEKYDGTKTDFCVLTGVPLNGKPVIGIAQPAVQNVSTGYARVFVSKEDYTKHTLTLGIDGRRYESYPYLDGWIGFHLIY